MFGRRSKGQSTLEYVILIGFVVSALIAMGVYMKRGVQGRLRESTDQVGEQYSAQYTYSNYDTNTEMVQHESVTGETTTTNLQTNYQKKKGSEKLKGFQDDE
ncbi:MAG: hypothetical protein AAB089_04445 [Nitrospirota bacterium]